MIGSPLHLIVVILLIPVWLYAIRFTYRRERREYLEKRNTRLYGLEQDHSAPMATFIAFLAGAMIFFWPIVIPALVAFMILKYIYLKIAPVLNKIDNKVEDKLNKWIED